MSMTTDGVCLKYRTMQPKLREMEVQCSQLQTERDVMKAQVEESKRYWQALLQQRLGELRCARQT